MVSQSDKRPCSRSCTVSGQKPSEIATSSTVDATKARPIATRIVAESSVGFMIQFVVN